MAGHVSHALRLGRVHFAQPDRMVGHGSLDTTQEAAHAFHVERQLIQVLLVVGQLMIMVVIMMLIVFVLVSMRVSNQVCQIGCSFCVCGGGKVTLSNSNGVKSEGKTASS